MFAKNKTRNSTLTLAASIPHNKKNKNKNMPTTAWTVFRFCNNREKIKILESFLATSPMQAVKKAIIKMFKASGNAAHEFADLYAQSNDRRKRRMLPYKYTGCCVERTKRTTKALAAVPSLKSHYYKPIAHRVANTDAASQSAPTGAPAHRVKSRNGCRGRHKRSNSVKGVSVDGEFSEGGSVDGEFSEGGSVDGEFSEGESIQKGAERRKSSKGKGKGKGHIHRKSSKGKDESSKGIRRFGGGQTWKEWFL